MIISEKWGIIVNYSFLNEEKTLRVFIKGDIDHHSATNLRQAVDAEIISKNPEKLIIDFSKLDFMDSSGIGFVLGRYRLIKGRGGDFLLTGVPDRQIKLFKMSGADRLFKIEGRITQ